MQTKTVYSSSSPHSHSSDPNIHNIAMANGITGQQFKEEFKTKLIEPLVIFRPGILNPPNQF